jgi:uncharacterized protein (TIGR02611 family)
VAQTQALPWNRRFRSWLRRNWLLDTAWRISVFVVGVSVVTIGIALLVLPGPGWGLIALGLIILASEYVWAQRLLSPLKQRLQSARAKAQQPQYRNHMRAAGAAVIVIVGVAVGAYVWRYGLSLDGVRGLWSV